MKKKSIAFIVIGIVLIVIGTTLLLTSNSNKDKEKFTKEYSSLFDIANEIYKNNEYLKLPKTNSGQYYMTLGEYKRRKYDLKLTDPTCPDTFEIIYFDIENKDKYENNPIYILKSCKDIIIEEKVNTSDQVQN